jgi:hypothetical protein
MVNINPLNPVFSNGRHRITYGFMVAEYGRAHNGTDLVPGSVGVNSGIIAIGGGVVESVKDTVRITLPLTPQSNWSHPDVLGNIVRIRHNNRFVSRYCHLAFGSIRVKPGDRVEKGQIIAAIGNTGLSTAPHLHFEVWDNGNRINPEPFLMGATSFGQSVGVNSPSATPKAANYSSTQNNIDQIARRVIAGEFGNAPERFERLAVAGYDSKVIQGRVNDILSGDSTAANLASVPARKPIIEPTVKSLETLAKEVIRGDWGNGDERMKRLNAAGYDARTVQARVNEILRKK